MLRFLRVSRKGNTKKEHRAMQVRKRNGNIVDYDREFIVRAVTLAAAAAAPSSPGTSSSTPSAA